jgi:hypothetical protein
MYIDNNYLVHRSRRCSDTFSEPRSVWYAALDEVRTLLVAQKYLERSE